jgi:hypothetical protein
MLRRLIRLETRHEGKKRHCCIANVRMYAEPLTGGDRAAGRRWFWPTDEKEMPQSRDAPARTAATQQQYGNSDMNMMAISEPVILWQRGSSAAVA